MFGNEYKQRNSSPRPGCGRRQRKCQQCGPLCDALAFQTKDEEKADTNRLIQDDDVIQVVQSGGQYQVVIGSHVSDVYRELTGVANFDGESEKSAEKGNPLNQLIDIISSIFTPF